MILLELFIGFLKVGCFAFGGAYGLFLYGPLMPGLMGNFFEETWT